MTVILSKRRWSTEGSLSAMLAQTKLLGGRVGRANPSSPLGWPVTPPGASDHSGRLVLIEEGALTKVLRAWGHYTLKWQNVPYFISMTTEQTSDGCFPMVLANRVKNKLRHYLICVIGLHFIGNWQMDSMCFFFLSFCKHQSQGW